MSALNCHSNVHIVQPHEKRHKMSSLLGLGAEAEQVEVFECARCVCAAVRVTLTHKPLQAYMCDFHTSVPLTDPSMKGESTLT